MASFLLSNLREKHSTPIVGPTLGTDVLEVLATHRWRRSRTEILKTQGDYHVPVHADVPDSNVIFIDEHDPHVHALGTKTIGMLGVDIAAAIASAIFHTTGKRVRDLPITLNQANTSG